MLVSWFMILTSFPLCPLFHFIRSSTAGCPLASPSSRPRLALPFNGRLSLRDQFRPAHSLAQVRCSRFSGIEGEECDEGGRKKWEEIGQEKQHGKFLFSVNVTYCYFPKCSYWSQIFSGRSTCGALGRPTSPPRLADQSGSRWDGGSRACAPEWLMDRRPLLGCWEVWLY